MKPSRAAVLRAEAKAARAEAAAKRAGADALDARAELLEREADEAERPKRADADERGELVGREEMGLTLSEWRTLTKSVPGHRIGHRVLVRRADLDAYLAARRVVRSGPSVRRAKPSADADPEYDRVFRAAGGA